MSWSVEVLNETVEAELDSLSVQMRAKFTRIAEMLEELGPHRVGMPYVRHLQGKLWEMRLRHRTSIARALYVTAPGRRIVVVRTFVKKTPRTPRREIDLGLRRAKEIE